MRACLHAWVGRRAAPSLEMSWVFRDQMHLVHLPVQSKFSPSLATCLSVLPDGAVMIKGRKQRGREVRKMLKDNLEVQASQKLVEKK